MKKLSRSCADGVAHRQRYPAPPLPVRHHHDDRNDNGRRGDYNWRGDRNDGWDPSRSYHDGKYRRAPAPAATIVSIAAVTAAIVAAATTARPVW